MNDVRVEGPVDSKLPFEAVFLLTTIALAVITISVVVTLVALP